MRFRRAGIDRSPQGGDSCSIPADTLTVLPRPDWLIRCGVGEQARGVRSNLQPIYSLYNIGFPLRFFGQNFLLEHIFDHRIIICMFENPKIQFQTKIFFSDLNSGEVRNPEFRDFFRKVAAVFDPQGSNPICSLDK